MLQRLLKSRRHGRKRVPSDLHTLQWSYEAWFLSLEFFVLFSCFIGVWRDTCLHLNVWECSLFSLGRNANHTVRCSWFSASEDSWLSSPSLLTHNLLDRRNINLGRTLPRHLAYGLCASGAPRTCAAGSVWRPDGCSLLFSIQSPLLQILPPFLLAFHFSVENSLSSPVCAHNRKLCLISFTRENARWPFASLVLHGPQRAMSPRNPTSHPGNGESFTQHRHAHLIWGRGMRTLAFLMDSLTFGPPPFSVQNCFLISDSFKMARIGCNRSKDNIQWNSPTKSRGKHIEKNPTGPEWTWVLASLFCLCLWYHRYRSECRLGVRSGYRRLGGL